MNTEPDIPPPPLPHQPLKLPPDQRLALEPMQKPVDFMGVFETVLRRPGQILHALSTGSHRPAWWLGLLMVLGLALFGFLLGTFSGGTQLWATPAKITGGVLASALICLPSFYIFLCLSGVEIRLSTACGLLLMALALTSLLLLALAPVVWLFTQATESPGFMGFLALGFWLVAISFGLQLIVAGAEKLGVTKSGYLLVWTTIFLVVTLQMSTALRPILGTSDHLFPSERKFFIEHWISSLEGK